jgi:Zn-dependent protease
MNEDQIALAGLWYVVFLLSTTCHEAAHALLAQLGGDRTAAHGGQVSLNPLPHIRREPFGMVLFPWLSYFSGGWMMGWASAPFDPHWSYRHPKRAAAMALAGPGANLALATIAGICIHIGIAAGAFRLPEYVRFTSVVLPAGAGLPEAAASFFSILFSLNILLAAFNMLPIPPLDGWSAIGLILPTSAARAMEQLGHKLGILTLVGLLIAWQVFGQFYAPVMRFAIGILYTPYR